MESNVLPKENRCSGDPKSKSVEASVKIDSISIDLINASERSEVAKCEHFSIRGYVSDVRKRDWKKCWPFASDDDDNKYEGQTCMLPPLHVPRFRFWHCQNCLPEIGVEGTSDECGSVHKSCCSGLKSNRICLHAPILGDSAVQLSDIAQTSELRIIEERKVDAYAASNLKNIIDPSSCVNKKEKEVHGGKNHIIGKTMGAGDKLNQEVEGMTCVGTTILSLMQKNPTDDIAVSSKCNRFVNLCKPVCGHQKVDAEFAGNLNCMVECASRVGEAGKETLMDNQQKNFLAFGKSEESGDAKEASNADKAHATEYMSQGLDECHRASSESADILGRNDLQDLHCDNPSGLPRRKTRKVRLLKELLNENGDGDIYSIRTEDSLSNATPDINAGADKLLAPQCQEGTQGNARRSLVQNRKKKLPQDEDWRPPETSSPGKPCKEVSMPKGAESTDAVTGPESEEDAFSRLGLQPGMKNWTKRRPDRSPIVGRKKHKKTLTFDECLSSGQRKENVPYETGDKMEDAFKGIAANVVSHNPLTVKEINLFPLPAQGIEGNSFCKMESKMPQVDDQQAFVTSQNHGILREGPMTWDGIQIMHSGSTSVPLHPEQDALSEKGLELSLNSYIATERHDRKHIPQVEDRRTSLLNWQVVTPEDQVARKAAETKYVENFSVCSKSVLDPPYGKGLYCEPSSKRTTYRIPFLNEKQNCTSRVNIGSCSLMQPKGFCSTSSNEKTNGLQDHLAFTRKANDQRANKISELGALDDIPMEIVELMARNQYERCLPDAEHDTHQFERTNNTKNVQTMDHVTIYGHGELPFLQHGTCQRQKSQAKNRRNGISKADESVGHTKQKSVDYFSQADHNQVNMTQLEQAHVPAGFEAFLRHREKLPIGIQYSASSSSMPSSPQNCKWVGNIDGKRPFYTSLQALGPCNTCQNIPQQRKEANHPWSSTMPSHIPFVHSIPQKCSPSSTNMKLLSHSPGSMNRANINGNHDLKFLNQNAANLEKQSGMFGAETHTRACAEFPYACKHNVIEPNQKQIGSLELYCNDTIPAMHLLSLMDARLRSSTPVNMDATPKFFKRPPTTHSNDPKQFSRLDSGAYKATNTIKHPPYHFHGKNQLAEDSQEPIPAIPTTGASTSSFRDDRRFKKASDCTTPVSQEKGKRKVSDSRVQNKGCTSQKSVSASIIFGTNCGSLPVHSMQTMFFGASDSMMCPMHLQALKNSTNHMLEAPSAAGTVHHKRSLETQLCSVNRNPADFSIPEAGNEYMIAGENLKVARADPFANGSGLVKLEGHKRQRKVSAAKEHGRRVKS